MNILVLNGSPKGIKSNTMKLTSKFIEGMKEIDSNLIFKQYNLSLVNLKNCSGCFGCWNNKNRVCSIKDDMPEMFKAYIESDIVIWSTPLYYYSMSSITKTFIERLLPSSSPLIVDTGNEYSHPNLYESMDSQKHIVISTCGFPEYHNFDLLRENMIKMVNATPENMIFTVMGELLSEKGLTSTISWYIDGVKNAGREFIQNGMISQTTRDLLANPLVPIDSFLEMANVNFECQKIDSENLLGDSTFNTGKAHNYLMQMKTVFNKNNGLNLDADIEFEFTDTKENSYFTIRNDNITLTSGSSNNPKLKIITSLKDWKQISDGELDGSQALADGTYKIRGSLEYLQKMDLLFGASSKPKKVEKSTEPIKFYGIKGENWMSVSFIPWILSWILFDFNPFSATTIPLVISLLILILKKKVNAVTYFEKMTGFYFLFISIFTYFFSPEASSYGTYINYFSIAAIWIFSIFGNISLTADYSKYSQETDLIGNPLFDKTNIILTLFWAFIFILQGIIKYLLVLNNLMLISYSVYLLIIVALSFTSFFSKWYPQFLATRE